MKNALCLDTYLHEKQLLWKLTGDMVLEETSALRKKFYESLNETPSDLMVIDFSGLTKIDASAVSLLVSFRNALNKKGRTLKLRKVPSNIYHLFEKTNLTLYFDIQRLKTKDQPQGLT